MIFLRLEDGVDVVEESIFGIFDLLGSACDSKCASAIVYWQMLCRDSVGFEAMDVLDSIVL